MRRYDPGITILALMEIDRAYQEALDYLYSFVDYSLTRGLRFTPDKFNLSRMVDLLTALGNPHLEYPVIHVAGSKGKGSVSAMCASVLRAAGYRVGFYTSPHLHDYCERIQVNGQQIDRQELVALIDEIKPVVASIPELTTFEITTALGFLYFARKKVNAAVIEVGLGGRLDATNVVTPVVSVITSISYDHIQVLGDTLEKIAIEKGGIIKPGIPVVISPQKDEVYQVLAKLAAERNSPLWRVGRDVGFERLGVPGNQPAFPVQLTHEVAGIPEIEEPDLSEQSLMVWLVNHPDKPGTSRVPGDVQPLRLTIPLLGLHQVENAATAYLALKVFSKYGHAVPEESMHSGFRNVFWPGRFEILQKAPVLVVDSAHNRDSARRLCETLDAYFPAHRITMIFGVSEDKDVAGMFAELLPRVERVIATRSFHPRAMEAGDLAQLALPFGKPVQVVDQVEDALELAMGSLSTYSQTDQEMILATGSLFIAAAVRETWLKQHGLNVYSLYA